MKTVPALLFPGAVLLGGVAALLMAAPQSPFVAEAAIGYPYVAIVAAILLAWRMKRSRLVVSALVFLTAYLSLQPYALGDDVLAHALIATFLPTGLAILSFMHDSTFTISSLRRHLLLVLAPLAAAAFFSAGNPAGAVELLGSRFGGVPVTVMVWCAALLAAAVSVVKRERPAEVGIALLIVAFVFAMSAESGSTVRSIWMLAGAMVLIVALIETAYAMAYHDELTGLPGRRALSQALAALEQPYAIAIVDIDHFKSFNDQHGHDVGDQVLCMVAAKLRAVKDGEAFRSGGEEFTLVFPGSTKREAHGHVEEVREAVENAEFRLRSRLRPHGKKAAAARGRAKSSAECLSVTVSVGIAAPTARNPSVEAVVKAADKAMYRAKTEGRNRVVA